LINRKKGTDLSKEAYEEAKNKKFDIPLILIYGI